MGYRSDVAAAFYVTHKQHLPILKLWLSENFPMDLFSGHTRWFDTGMLLEEEGTKWYSDYDEVKAFDVAVRKFHGLIAEFDKPVTAITEDKPPQFCYEFIRVGENYDDVETEYFGDGCQYLLGVERKITIEEW